jgi:3,4-dihydroxy 2-butanone 4-phosphate synthase/GTP cyclohydrolase II
LAAAFEAIEAEGSGYIIYLRDHEGRGIGLAEKIAAYVLQDAGLDTVDANLELGHPVDAREYRDLENMLRLLDLRSIRLLTNNPVKVEALTGSGIDVTRVGLEVEPSAANEFYLKTKQERMHHALMLSKNRGE